MIENFRYLDHDFRYLDHDFRSLCKLKTPDCDMSGCISFEIVSILYCISLFYSHCLLLDTIFYRKDNKIQDCPEKGWLKRQQHTRLSQVEFCGDRLKMSCTMIRNSFDNLYLRFCVIHANYVRRIFLLQIKPV